MTPRFAILVPAFHMGPYIARALCSALEQEYEHFRVIVVEDHGADATLSEIMTVMAQHPLAWKISKFWSNIARKGILGNHVSMLEQCEADEIAVCLDGDDQLAHPHVLTRLAEEYRDPDTWLTYGSYEYDAQSHPNGAATGICVPMPADNHTRHAGWCATHLKTFYVGLFRQISDSDLRFYGEYIDPAGDVALMVPMLEMAGPKHAKFIEDILYLYNGANPMNDVKIKPGWIRVMTEEIRRRPVYNLLEHRSW